MGQTYNQKLDHHILEHIWEHSSEAIFTIGYDGSVINANPAFQQLLGWDLVELQGIALPPFINDMNRTEQVAFLQKLKDGNNFPFEIVDRKHKDGTELTILASYHVLKQDDVLAIAIYKDFTEHMKIQQQLQESEQNYRMLIENLPEAIVKIKDGKINLANSSAVELFQVDSLSAMMGRSIWEFISSDHREKIDNVIAKLFAKGYRSESETVTAKLRGNAGNAVWLEVKLILIETEEANEVQLVLRDITEKRKYESRLEYLAYHDPLTGLKNRTIFTDIISESIEMAKEIDEQLSLMYIDIDHFKSINDSLGHNIGDDLLKQFAHRLRGAVRKDDVACRIGGDEFLVLLLNIPNRDEVENIANRILVAFEKPFIVNGKKVSLTVSIGISVFPQDGLIGRDLIHHADVALYQAKKERNRYKFYKK